MAAQAVKPNKPYKPRSPKTRAIVRLKTEQPTLTTRQIGAIVGCSHVNVYETLQRYNIDHSRVHGYKANRSEIFAGIQERVVSTLTVDDIKGASVRDRAILLGTIYDKERLERGQATQITDSRQLTGSLRDLVDVVAGRRPVDRARAGENFHHEIVDIDSGCPITHIMSPGDGPKTGSNVGDDGRPGGQSGGSGADQPEDKSDE